MGTLAPRSVVLVNFPFSDLTSSKVRPALVLADAGHGDWILCQITSNPYSDTTALLLENHDFAAGSLKRTSFIRPGKLFTANASLIMDEAGQLTFEKQQQVISSIVNLLRGDLTSPHTRG